MNKTYQLIWHALRRTWVACSERSKHNKKSRAVLLVSVSSVMGVTSPLLFAASIYEGCMDAPGGQAGSALGGVKVAALKQSCDATGSVYWGGNVAVANGEQGVLNFTQPRVELWSDGGQTHMLSIGGSNADYGGAPKPGATVNAQDLYIVTSGNKASRGIYFHNPNDASAPLSRLNVAGRLYIYGNQSSEGAGIDVSGANGRINVGESLYTTAYNSDGIRNSGKIEVGKDLNVHIGYYTNNLPAPGQEPAELLNKWGYATAATGVRNRDNASEIKIKGNALIKTDRGAALENNGTFTVAGQLTAENTQNNLINNGSGAHFTVPTVAHLAAGSGHVLVNSGTVTIDQLALAENKAGASQAFLVNKAGLVTIKQAQKIQSAGHLVIAEGGQFTLNQAEELSSTAHSLKIAATGEVGVNLTNANITSEKVAVVYFDNQSAAAKAQVTLDNSKVQAKLGALVEASADNQGSSQVTISKLAADSLYGAEFAKVQGGEVNLSLVDSQVRGATQTAQNAKLNLKLSNSQWTLQSDAPNSSFSELELVNSTISLPGLANSARSSKQQPMNYSLQGNTTA